MQARLSHDHAAHPVHIIRSTAEYRVLTNHTAVICIINVIDDINNVGGVVNDVYGLAIDLGDEVVAVRVVSWRFDCVG